MPMATEITQQTLAVNPATGAALVREYESAHSAIEASWPTRAQKSHAGRRNPHHHLPPAVSADRRSRLRLPVHRCRWQRLLRPDQQLHVAAPWSCPPGHQRGSTRATRQGHDLRDRARGADRLGEILAERVASVDMVRYTNSGTEATMNAVRAARAFTGRELIVKMEGGYHGSLRRLRSQRASRPDPRRPGPKQPTAVIDTRGVADNTLDNVLIIPVQQYRRAERLCRRSAATTSRRSSSSR